MYCSELTHFSQPGRPAPELFRPAIALFINDNPEGQRLCGVYDSMICKFPCRMCGCSGADLENPRAGAASALRLRLPNEIRTAQLAHYINKSARDKALKAISGAFGCFRLSSFRHRYTTYWQCTPNGMRSTASTSVPMSTASI